jgi:DUF4097 and DUF4098 domain-containing protein YvlB
MLRLLIVFLLSTFNAVAAADYEEVRELVIDATSLTDLMVDAGAGELTIIGAQVDQISVTATIVVDDNERDARKTIERELVLTLDRSGKRANLISHFESSGWSSGNSGVVHLDVKVPSHLNLQVEDGSGGTTIREVSGIIQVDDGSGALEITDSGGTVTIDDGSGSVTLARIAGDVSISDGSGDIRIRTVSGSVRVEDGSGSIDISDVAQNLLLEETGSGRRRFSDIRGTVEQRD